MLYTMRSDGAAVTFDGMTQDQVVAMLADQGLTCTFITADQMPPLVKL